MGKHQKKNPITVEADTGPDLAQMKRMLTRYQTLLEKRAKVIEDNVREPNLDRARGLIALGLDMIAAEDRTSASYALGFVQGILLCEDVYSWEYLATDDTRK